jgi:hypothetical protein
MTPHGSASTYGNHGCRCQPCRDAHAEVTRARRARRAELLARYGATIEHGASAYLNWGCRCDVCAASAWARAGRRWRQSRPAG